MLWSLADCIRIKHPSHFSKSRIPNLYLKVYTKSCGPDGTFVNFGWSAFTPINASEYLLRLNKFPTGDWFNSAGGDQTGRTSGSAIAFNITPDWDYQWDVQGIRPYESYPYTGERCPFETFQCVAPRPAWWQAVGGDIHADDGNVSSNIPNTCIGSCKPF